MPAAAGLPDDLLALYDRLRAQKGGVGAAAAAGPRAAAAAGSRSTTPSSPSSRRPERRGDPLRGVPADPGAHLGVRSVTRRAGSRRSGRSSSRPTVGPAATPAPRRTAPCSRTRTTGEVIAEDGTTIGVATNNVAEYAGLIAGLKLAEEFAPEADIEVRMDSKLVVEQMSGRWKIKHPDMRPLAIEASRLAPFGTTYTWVPAGAEQARRPARQRGARRAAARRHGGRPDRTRPTRAPEASSRSSGRGSRRGDRRQRPARGWAQPGTPTDHGGPRPARRDPHTVDEAVLRRARRAATPGSATRAAPRSGPPPTGWRRWPSEIDAVVVLAGAPDRWSRPRSSPRRLGHAGGGRARLRRDGVRALGRADLRGGRASGTPTTSTRGSARSTSRPVVGESFRVVEAARARRAASGCSRPTRARPWSWSAT